MLSGGGAPTISKVDLSSLFFATKRTRGVSFLPRLNWNGGRRRRTYKMGLRFRLTVNGSKLEFLSLASKQYGMSNSNCSWTMYKTNFKRVNKERML